MKLPLYIHYIFSFNETENTQASVKMYAILSTVKVRSAWGKHRAPENEFKDRQKERMHGNRLRKILKNHRKHTSRVEGRHQWAKKGYKGKQDDI